MEKRYKIYVGVTVYYDIAGNITPLSIHWEDGRVFEIDRVLDSRRAASLKAGGMGIRYTVRIQGQERYLFYELGQPPERWFVEAPSPQ